MEVLLGGFADEIDRIDAAAVFEHFEVQVRPCRAAGFTHVGNGLSFLDLVADNDQVFRVMRVTGRIPVTVVNLDHDAVAVAISRPGYDTVSDCSDRITVFAREIDTRVIRRFAGEWIRTLAKVG